MASGTPSRRPNRSTALVSKLKTQRGIKIDHKVIPGANHFFQDKTEDLVEVCRNYLDRRMSAES